MAHSVKLYFNSQRIKQNGTATVYIQIIIGREKMYINMKFSFDVERIDTNKNLLLPRQNPDIECSDYNLVLGREFGKINEIFRFARLSGRELTIKEFQKEYKHFESREDFITFWENELAERKKEGIIRESTYKSQRSSLESLKKFRTRLTFTEIDQKMLDTLKAFMANKLELDSDSIWTKLKDFRTYLNLAIKAGHVVNYPFLGFAMPKQEGRLTFLNEEEFTTLKNFFYSRTLTPGTNKEKALRAFLFMCYTGVRIGDLRILTHAHIKQGVLTFKPQKNRKELQKTVEIPLNSEALKLIITESKRLFDLPSEPVMRNELSEIAERIGLNQTCSPHQARHTFATRFLRKGGRLEVLQKLLGHEDIKTTMVYVHVDNEQKTREINFLD